MLINEYGAIEFISEEIQNIYGIDRVTSTNIAEDCKDYIIENMWREFDETLRYYMAEKLKEYSND